MSWKFEWSCVPATNKMISREHYKADSQVHKNKMCFTLTFLLQYQYLFLGITLHISYFWQSEAGGKIEKFKINTFYTK